MHGSGRVLTTKLYLTWCDGDGGEIMLAPDGSDPVVLKPLSNRVVLFWSAKMPYQVQAGCRYIGTDSGFVLQLLPVTRSSNSHNHTQRASEQLSVTIWYEACALVSLSLC